MWQMMITWGKSMMITTLLMVPLTYNSGKIHQQRRNSNLELALRQVIHLISGVWERSTLPFATSCLFWHQTDQTKRKQNRHCVIQARVNTVLSKSAAGESDSVVLNCRYKEREKGDGGKIRDTVWMLYYSEFLQGQKHTHHLLPLASLRSTRGNELSGIDFRVCAAMCSSPRHFSPGG